MTSPRVRTPLARRMGTKILAGVLAGSTLLGAAVVAPDIAAAQEAPNAEDREQRLAERQQRFEERIAEAIEDGKLSDEEAAELRAKIEERRAQAEERRAQRQADRQARLDDLAASLGTTADELKAALQDGQSIADIAAAGEIDVQDIIDGMVAEAHARIDASDRIDADKAAELKANIEERITARVNGERPERGDGEGRFRGPRGNRGGN